MPTRSKDPLMVAATVSVIVTPSTTTPLTRPLTAYVRVGSLVAKDLVFASAVIAIGVA